MMTDQRKDEMPDEIWASEIQVHGMFKNMYVHQSEPQDKTGITRYVRADLSPPVPDDVAEAVSTVETFIENLNNGEAKIKLFKDNIGIITMDDYTKLISVLKTLIRAASTPSAEVRAFDKLHDFASNNVTELEMQIMALREALESAILTIIILTDGESDRIAPLQEVLNKTHGGGG